MKLKISLTVDLTIDQVNILTKMAESCGFGGDDRTPREKIKRYLIGRVEDTVAYCHERYEREYLDEE